MKNCSRPLRVLYADDNDILGDVMLCLLAREGLWAEHVENGLTAWTKLSETNAATEFDVLVTDHEMPGLDGLRLVERIRASGRHLRVIVHTSGLPQATIEHYRRLGVETVVFKGCRPDELLRAVQSPTA